jgi:hypothetical protein
MVKELTAEVKYITELLTSGGGNTDWERVLVAHERKIGYFQHERLIHLIVTLFIALFTLLFYFSMLIYPKMELILITVVLILLSLAYFYHYYRLENGVQKLYKLSELIEKKINK